MGPPIWPFIAFFEARVAQALIRSPRFHQMVRGVHRRMHEMRHGKIEIPPEELGGTHVHGSKVDRGGLKRFMELFWEEMGNGSKPKQRSDR